MSWAAAFAIVGVSWAVSFPFICWFCSFRWEKELELELEKIRRGDPVE